MVEVLNDRDNPRIILLTDRMSPTRGGGCRREFAERFEIPLATMLSGRGAIPDSHPLALGVFGYGGSRPAIDAIRSDETDVLIVIGSGLSQRDTMQWGPKMLPSTALIHIDADLILIGRTWPSDVPVVANAAAALERLAALDSCEGLEQAAPTAAAS